MKHPQIAEFCAGKLCRQTEEKKGRIGKKIEWGPCHFKVFFPPLLEPPQSGRRGHGARGLRGEHRSAGRDGFTVFGDRPVEPLLSGRTRRRGVAGQHTVQGEALGFTIDI